LSAPGVRAQVCTVAFKGTLLSRYSIRTIELKRLLGLIALALVSVTLLGSYAQGKPQGVPLTPIKHVVFIMKENQSFDDYFGVYPYGPDDALRDNPTVRDLSVPYGIQGNASEIAVPNYPGLGWLLGYSHLRYLNSSTQANPGEGWVAYRGDWDWGRMDGFVTYSGPQSLVYVSYEQIPFYWDYAEEYVLCDNYYAPVMSETLPNRLASLAGFAPVSNDYGPPPYVPLNDTIFYQLTEHGVSWGYFELFSTTRDPPSSEIYPLNSISGFASDTAYMNRVENISVFLSEARNGSLPAVSFVMPFGLAGEDGVPDVSEHPPANITLGQDWTVNLVDAVMEGPDWNSSAIFITWDEWGGFYDGVPPPQLNAFGYGGRVPMLVISPYAKEDYVDSALLNHDSVLNFIDYNWGLPYLGPWVASSGSLLSAFDFAQKPRPPIVLGPTPGVAGTPGVREGTLFFENGSSLVLNSRLTSQQYPIPLQIPLNQLNYTSPPFELPASTYEFEASPVWLPSFQFLAVVISSALLLSAPAVGRNKGKRVKLSVIGSALIFSSVSSALGLVFTAVPVPPAPPSQLTFSLLTGAGLLLTFVGVLGLAWPVLADRLKKMANSGSGTVPAESRGARSLWGSKATEFVLCGGVLVLMAGLLLTPGMVFPVATYTPKPIAPPQTFLGDLLQALTPLTGLSSVLVVSSFSLMVFTWVRGGEGGTSRRARASGGRG